MFGFGRNRILIRAGRYATKLTNGDTARAREALANVAKTAAIKAAGWKVVISYLQTSGFNLGGGLFLRLDP